MCGVGVRAAVQRVKHPVLVVVIVLNRIDASVAVVVLAGLSRSNEAARTAVHRVFDTVLVIVVVFEVVMASVAVVVVHRGIVTPVLFAHGAGVVDVQHRIVVIVFIRGFVQATVAVVIVPREGDPRLDVVGAVVIGNGDAVTVFVGVAGITDTVVVEVGLGGVSDGRAIVGLVDEAVLVVVLIRASVRLNVALFGGNPPHRSLGAQVVFVENTILVVIQIFREVSTTVTVMVGNNVGCPSDITRWAIIVHVQHTVSINVIVTRIAIGVPVEVGLVVVGEAGAVVEPVQHPVEVQIGLVQPYTHVVMIALLERMSAVGTVVVGDEGDDR